MPRHATSAPKPAPSDPLAPEFLERRLADEPPTLRQVKRLPLSTRGRVGMAVEESMEAQDQQPAAPEPSPSAGRHAVHHVTPDELRRAGATFFGPAGEWAFAMFDELNALCFAGHLRPRPILWGLTPHGRSLGFYSSDSGAITLHPALLSPSGDAWGKAALMGERFAADVLLHEMVHAAQRELMRHTRFGGNDTHNCDTWCRQIVRITPLLGLPPIQAQPVRQKRVGGAVTWYVEPGHLTRAQMATWPHSIRPAGYYEAATRELVDRVM